MGKRQGSMPPEVYEAVMVRSRGRCEASATIKCQQWAGAWHHRQLRSQGGRHEVVNGLAVCTRCHTWIHANPRVARENGWLVSAYREPAEMPVKIKGRFWKILTEQGTYIDAMEVA